MLQALFPLVTELEDEFAVLTASNMHFQFIIFQLNSKERHNQNIICFVNFINLFITVRHVLSQAYENLIGGRNSP
jgi:hypothetical protein